MSNKALRILIADACREQCLHIEKRLNRLGYYRIAPVCTFEELVLLTSPAQGVLDVLIGNKALALPRGIDLHQFCRDRPHIRNALFYGNPEPTPVWVSPRPPQAVQASLAAIPDAESWGLLMGLIDPPPQRPRLEAL